MPKGIKNVDQKIDELEAATKKYASKDTVISIGGYEFTPAKLMIAFTIVSSTLGGLYGAFEVYKDYQGMKKKIAEYVSPDLTEIHKKLELTQQAAEKSVQYTQDIKNDLKSDIRRVEQVAENVERSSKQAQRETETEVKSVRSDLRANLDRNRDDMDKIKREVDNKIDRLNRDLDSKIQKAIDNPLSK